MAEKIILDNGLRIVCEPMPHLHSVATGLWVNSGSAAEPEQLAGVSHFLEHMLFKGTAKRGAAEISRVMDGVGGVLNAFTGKEQTCFYTRCLDEHFELGLELLADMCLNSLLDGEQFDREKQVIVEEINMYEDSPDEVAGDLFARTLWPEHSYGRSVAGSLSSVGALGRDAMYDYWRMAYTPAQAVLAVAGNIEPRQVVEQARRYLGGFSGGAGAASLNAPRQQGGQAYIYKDIEQTHICLGLGGVAVDDADYFPLYVLVNALGGGASARLFQEVREKRGLAYSAYCFLDSYKLSGAVCAYAATQPQQAEELARVMAGQFADVAEHGLSGEELERSKNQLKGSLLLGAENPVTVMGKLGRFLCSLDELYSLEHTVAQLAAVSSDDIRRVTARLFVPGQLALAQVGPREAELDAKELF
ncbi:MAG: pitrilysin family protein [Bacillota bacterium]|nr:pitrilysin family protein [Bacillota bacterium]